MLAYAQEALEHDGHDPQQQHPDAHHHLGPKDNQDHPQLAQKARTLYTVSKVDYSTSVTSQI